MGATVRTISRKDNSSTNPWGIGHAEFPLDKDGIIYVRQSSIVQVMKNIHSFEMQTDKFEEHFRTFGCTGHIEIIADDEALSGTLDIHERPGMMRMVQKIESRQVGWIGAVHVNRLTRDPWLLTPAQLVKTCYKYDVWIATLRSHFNFRDNGYSQRVFMMEAEESARHLEWMKLTLGGGKRTASDNGLYDGRPLPFGYIVDRTDPKHKKYIVYRPHAEIVFWLFKRFFELDGNFPELCRGVEKMPYLFPPFEAGIDTKGIRHFKRKKTLYPEIGFKPSADGLIGILTNPVYIGWWIPLDGGVVENNHEPIVEEWLFTYAHKRLSVFDFQGKRQKPERVIRNGEVEGLLKKVSHAPTGLPVYATSEGKNNTEMYRYAERRALGKKHIFDIPVALIDDAFLQKFFERLKRWEGCEDWTEKLERIQKSRQTREDTINSLIQQAQEQWNEAMSILTNPKIEKTAKMQQALAKQCSGLEAKIAELENDLNQPGEEEEEDQIIQYQIYTLLPDLFEEWEFLPFEQKLRFIGALVRRAVLNRPAPGWARLEIEWKRNDWETDLAFIRMDTHGGSWTQEEEEVLKGMYPGATAMEIIQALPTRTWHSVKEKACKLHLRRKKGDGNKSAGYQDFWTACYNDTLLAQEHGLDLNQKNPQWRKLLPESQRHAHSHRP